MTKWDRILIVFVIIISLSGLYIVKGSASNNGTLYAKIEVNGEEYKKISLGPNMVGETLDINTEFGHNKIEFGDGKVRVMEADCPDELDVKQGWISRPREVIVCLPNKLVIELISDKKIEDDIDYISH